MRLFNPSNVHLCTHHASVFHQENIGKPERSQAKGRKELGKTDLLRVIPTMTCQSFVFMSWWSVLLYTTSIINAMVEALRQSKVRPCPCFGFALTVALTGARRDVSTHGLRC